MANEIVRLYWNSQASPLAAELLEAGTFTLTFGGQETSSLDYNASSETIQAALEALSSIGVGNVSVSSVADGFTIEFIGSLANTNVGAVTETLTAMKQKADTVTIVVTQAGAVDVPTSPSNSTTTTAVAPVNEVQTVDYGGAASGTFDLNGNSSSASVDVSNGSSLQTALDTLFGSGNCAVAGVGPYTVTFQGAFAATPVATMSVSNNMTDGSPSVSANTDGVAGVHQVDTCTFSTGAAVAGSFTWDGSPKSYTDTPTVSGAVVTGSASTGTITTTWNDYNANAAIAVSNTDLVSVAGQQHIQTVTLSDSPTEGTFAISCGAQSGNCAYDVAAGDLATAFGQAANNGTSYNGVGTGPWTITSVDKIASPGAFTGADGQNGGGHLRKALGGTQIVVIQAGESVSGGVAFGAAITDSIHHGQFPKITRTMK